MMISKSEVQNLKNNDAIKKPVFIVQVSSMKNDGKSKRIIQVPIYDINAVTEVITTSKLQFETDVDVQEYIILQSAKELYEIGKEQNTIFSEMAFISDVEYLDIAEDEEVDDEYYTDRKKFITHPKYKTAMTVYYLKNKQITGVEIYPYKYSRVFQMNRWDKIETLLDEKVKQHTISPLIDLFITAYEELLTPKEVESEEEKTEQTNKT